MLAKMSYDPEAVVLQFDAVASGYDDDVIKMRYAAAQKIAELVIQSGVQPHRILDVGAGTGVLSELLLRHFKEATLYALDLSPQMLKQLKTKKLARVYPFEGNILKDKDKCPLPSNLDLVVSAGVFDYIPDLKKALENVTRNLNEGGVLAFTTYDRKELNKAGIDLSLDPDKKTELDNVYSYGQEEVVKILDELGFDVVKSPENFTAYEEKFRDVKYNAFIARKRERTPTFS